MSLTGKKPTYFFLVLWLGLTVCSQVFADSGDSEERYDEKSGTVIRVKSASYRPGSLRPSGEDPPPSNSKAPSPLSPPPYKHPPATYETGCPKVPTYTVRREGASSIYLVDLVQAARYCHNSAIRDDIFYNKEEIYTHFSHIYRFTEGIAEAVLDSSTVDFKHPLREKGDRVARRIRVRVQSDGVHTVVFDYANYRTWNDDLRMTLSPADAVREVTFTADITPPLALDNVTIKFKSVASQIAEAEARGRKIIPEPPLKVSFEPTTDAIVAPESIIYTFNVYERLSASSVRLIGTEKKSGVAPKDGSQTLAVPLQIAESNIQVKNLFVKVTLSDGSNEQSQTFGDTQTSSSQVAPFVRFASFKRDDTGTKGTIHIRTCSLVTEGVDAGYSFEKCVSTASFEASDMANTIMGVKRTSSTNIYLLLYEGSGLNYIVRCDTTSDTWSCQKSPEGWSGQFKELFLMADSGESFVTIKSKIENRATVYNLIQCGLDQDLKKTDQCVEISNVTTRPSLLGMSVSGSTEAIVLGVDTTNLTAPVASHCRFTNNTLTCADADPDKTLKGKVSLEGRFGAAVDLSSTELVTYYSRKSGDSEYSGATLVACSVSKSGDTRKMSSCTDAFASGTTKPITFGDNDSTDLIFGNAITYPYDSLNRLVFVMNNYGTPVKSSLVMCEMGNGGQLSACKRTDDLLNLGIIVEDAKTKDGNHETLNLSLIESGTPE